MEGPGPIHRSYERGKLVLITMVIIIVTIADSQPIEGEEITSAQCQLSTTSNGC